MSTMTSTVPRGDPPRADFTPSPSSRFTRSTPRLPEEHSSMTDPHVIELEFTVRARVRPLPTLLGSLP